MEQATYKLPDDDELKSAYEAFDSDEEAYNKNLEKQAIQEIIDEANSYADGGDWDSAVELLESSKEAYTDNVDITKAYEEILSKMPITLKNLTMVSSNEVEVYKNVDKDRWGNIYDGYVSYYCYSSYRDPAYGLYNLNGKFTKFNGTFYVPTNADSDAVMSLSVYIDEVLTYYKDGITVETEPTSISLDVSGHKTMRIVMQTTDEYNGRVCFGNTSFDKAGDSSAQ